jgi:hypothetical protein
VSEDNARTLSRDQARTFYDRFGKSQDLQNFYEHPATNALIAHAQLERANSVFELGCGTGSFADDLIARRLFSATGRCGLTIRPALLTALSPITWLTYCRLVTYSKLCKKHIACFRRMESYAWLALPMETHRFPEPFHPFGHGFAPYRRRWLAAAGR